MVVGVEPDVFGRQIRGPEPGGRRALTTYGPVLALMVPVTLLFLLYPTLVGLRSLAGDP